MEPVDKILKKRFGEAKDSNEKKSRKWRGCLRFKKEA
jgi:hypothetical protein